MDAYRPAGSSRSGHESIHHDCRAGRGSVSVVLFQCDGDSLWAASRLAHCAFCRRRIAPVACMRMSAGLPHASFMGAFPTLGNAAKPWAFAVFSQSCFSWKSLAFKSLDSLNAPSLPGFCSAARRCRGHAPCTGHSRYRNPCRTGDAARHPHPAPRGCCGCVR